MPTLPDGFHASLYGDVITARFVVTGTSLIPAVSPPEPLQPLRCNARGDRPGSRIFFRILGEKSQLVETIFSSSIQRKMASIRLTKHDAFD